MSRYRQTSKKGPFAIHDGVAVTRPSSIAGKRASKRDGDEAPNFLIIMSDEHGAEFSSAYHRATIATPNMDRLAEEGVIFDAAYCNSPLSVPSRINFMTGQHNWHCKGWDNATALRYDAMTWPYLLRSQGYEVVLAGKMHLVGADNLHGFNRQIADDIHSRLKHPIHRWSDGIRRAPDQWPGVFETGAEAASQLRSEPSISINRGKIPTGPGRTVEIDTDDRATANAVAYLYGAAALRQPFALCVGLIAPHFPFVVPERYFSRYYPDKADLPNIPPGHLENLPPAARRLVDSLGFWGYSDEQIRRARAAYYGLITYMDEKIGMLLNALEAEGLADNTVVIYTSDHGDNLGEHGLWRKMCFYEQSARIPLQIRWPGRLPGGIRVPQCVSLVDLTATILDMAGIGIDEQKSQWAVDGDPLLDLMAGKSEGWKDEAFGEHNAHGTDRPRAMLRQGPWKLCYNYGDPEEFELYNLDSDPGEFTNLAGDPRHREIQQRLFRRITELWDGEKVDYEVRASQEERLLIREVAPNDMLF